MPPSTRIDRIIKNADFFTFSILFLPVNIKGVSRVQASTDSRGHDKIR